MKHNMALVAVGLIGVVAIVGLVYLITNIPCSWYAYTSAHGVPARCVGFYVN